LVEIEVLLPKADPNMSEGRIMEWIKKEGDR
jgi:pyruvate/2-oxoglutarate dehydrogenase complex dihydrolipoamide acyltransferase (E2) component